jgi:hypothetical protein
MKATAYVSAKILLVVLVMGGFSMGAESALAHELVADGSINAELHVSPWDDPIVGESATFLLIFTDKNGQFKLENCDCRVVITRDGQETFSQNLTKPTFNYTFPERAAYKLEVTGQPKQNAKFQTFKLDFDLRVDRTTPKKIVIPEHADDLVVLGAGLLIIGVLYLKDRRKQRKKETVA